MNRRHIIIALAVLVFAGAIASALYFAQIDRPEVELNIAEVEEGSQAANLEKICTSSATHDRLKEIIFTQAAGLGGADPATLNQLAAKSVVRIENPIVKNVDQQLNVVICGGRMVLELPPGAERAFAGQRRLIAFVEYGAQPAIDGSGFFYELKGAEPITYRIAEYSVRDEVLDPAAINAVINAEEPDESEENLADEPADLNQL